MKKVILLLIFVSLALTASAQVNLDFTINIEDKIYFPNEKVKVEVSVINRDVSFAAKNAILTLTIADREYSFKLGDVSAGQTFSKEITLPEFPPGTHTIKGVLNYTGIFDETFTIETYNSFEVRFPEIERYPRNVNVIGFNLPDKMIAGKTYDVSVVVKNEGTVGGSMIIEVASLEEFVDEETFLGPGESKTINLKVNFKNTEVSLIEARVYALINGVRYLLVYSGKKAYLEPERIAKLSVDRVEFVDEPDDQINQNDEVKLNIFIKNTGNYPASSVLGILKSPSGDVEAIVSNSDYNLIQNGQSSAPLKPFVIKSKDAKPGQYSLTLDVNYEDSEKHTVSFDVPLTTSAGSDACSKDTDCTENEVCRKGKCEAVSCECGFVKDKQCIKYDCCGDSECGSYGTCNTAIHKCVEKTGCLNILFNGPTSSKLDLLFVGDGFDNYEDMKEEVKRLIDYDANSGYNGLMSVEPFKSTKQKFNAWVIKAPDYKYDCVGDFPCEPDTSHVAVYEAKCPQKDYTIVVSKKPYRSFAFFNGPAFTSIMKEASENRGRLILHEFGHSFGLLRDEYTENGMRDDPGTPNCAPNVKTAEQWWENLRINYENLDYFQGCSYTEDNVRPTKNSIMRQQRHLKDDYGPVNERFLLKRLGAYE